MQKKFHHIIIAFGILIFAPPGILISYGQDTAGSPSYDAYDPESDRERERVITSPGENAEPPVVKPSIQTSTSKDSTGRSPVQRYPKHPSETPKTNPVKPKSEDDSILSFNFLYYIIQKYKLQDIID